MSTMKSQSPGPNPATSQPKQARSRKAAMPAEQSAAGRAGSAGGILLDAKGKPSPVPSAAVTPAPKAAPTITTTAANATTGPNRQRRRPRKLNKEPAPAQSTTGATTNTTTTASPAQTELEALKSRVRGLEAKVEELYTSTEARTGHSPRRRGKGRKGSSATQVPTHATLATSDPPSVEEEEEADEELGRLEDELETARRELEVYQPRTRPRTKRSTSGESVEEIPRDGSETVTVGDRQVTLSGSYRIPLPATLDMKDVQKIQSGVSAAQNVAKSFLDQRRAAQAAKPPAPPAASASSAAKPKATTRKASAPPSMEISKENGGKGWGEWFGGYSMAVSRAVKNIEAEAAIESQKAARPSTRPAPANRSVSAASTVKKNAPAAGATKRPGMKGRQANLSSEQV